MTYTVHDAQGTPIAGDATLSDNMRDLADERGGYITNDTTGAVVHPLEG